MPTRQNTIITNIKLVVVVIISLLYLSCVYADVIHLTTEEIVEKCKPAVVLIESHDGSGSGFIVHPKGYIITNYHVVKGAKTLFVKLLNGDVYSKVRVVKTQPAHDIAILKVDGKNMPFLSIKDTCSVTAGERVVVIGNPLGHEGTVTDGLVSTIKEPDPGYKEVQISAAINPGNSGGPVINMRGKVIGIATWKDLRGEGLGFAVSIDCAKSLLSKHIINAQQVKETTILKQPRLKRTSKQGALLKEFRKQRAQIEKRGEAVQKDIIHLKNGRVLKGVIIEQLEKLVKINIGAIGKMSISKEDIESIEEFGENKRDIIENLKKERTALREKYYKLMKEEGMVELNGKWVPKPYVRSIIAWRKQEKEKKHREAEVQKAIRERERAKEAAEKAQKKKERAKKCVCRATEYWNNAVFDFNQGSSNKLTYASTVRVFESAEEWFKKARLLYKEAIFLAPKLAGELELNLGAKILEAEKLIERCKTLAREARREGRR